MRKTPTHTAQRASFAAGELLRELSARESCVKTRSRGKSERLESVACRAASLLTPFSSGTPPSRPGPAPQPSPRENPARAAPQTEPVRVPPPAPARTLRVPSQPGRADRSTAPRASPQPRRPRLSFPSQLPPSLRPAPRLLEVVQGVDAAGGLPVPAAHPAAGAAEHAGAGRFLQPAGLYGFIAPRGRASEGRAAPGRAETGNEPQRRQPPAHTSAKAHARAGHSGKHGPALRPGSAARTASPSRHRGGAAVCHRGPGRGRGARAPAGSRLRSSGRNRAPSGDARSPGTPGLRRHPPGPSTCRGPPPSRPATCRDPPPVVTRARPAAAARHLRGNGRVPGEPGVFSFPVRTSPEKWTHEP